MVFKVWAYYGILKVWGDWRMMKCLNCSWVLV
jgi:hypothetical protein